MQQTQPRQPAPSTKGAPTQKPGSPTGHLRGMGYAAASAAVGPSAQEPPDVAALKARYGALLGQDLSRVNVHTGSQAPDAADAAGFATGTDVHLGISAEELGSDEGQELIAHELVHAAQSMRACGEEMDETLAEAEAEDVAAMIVAGIPATVAQGAAPGAKLHKKKKPKVPNRLTPAQEWEAITFNAKRFTTSKMVQIQKTVGVPADGIVGPQTVEAIAAFQAAHGLEPDGKVGPLTKKALGVAPPKKPKPAKPKPGGGQAGNLLTPAQEASAISYNEARGFSKAQRIQIQEIVGADPDGDIGPKTVERIAAWQKGHHLEADGKVGPGTSAKMGIKPAGGGSVGISPNASNGAKLSYAKKMAPQFGLVITSTTGGKHAPGSYHYAGRAIDVAGSASAMAKYYNHMKQLKPTELFYDPLGGIKYGQEIGAIGGHSDHVHVAF